MRVRVSGAELAGAYAAEQVLRAALKLPLAENRNEAERPNGVFR